MLSTIAVCALAWGLTGQAPGPQVLSVDVASGQLRRVFLFLPEGYRLALRGRPS